jgi:hypothetical protein
VRYCSPRPEPIERPADDIEDNPFEAARELRAKISELRADNNRARRRTLRNLSFNAQVQHPLLWNAAVHEAGHCALLMHCGRTLIDAIARTDGSGAACTDGAEPYNDEHDLLVYTSGPMAECALQCGDGELQWSGEGTADGERALEAGHGAHGAMFTIDNSDGTRAKDKAYKFIAANRSRVEAIALLLCAHPNERVPGERIRQVWTDAPECGDELETEVLAMDRPAMLRAALNAHYAEQSRIEDEERERLNEEWNATDYVPPADVDET